MKPKLLLRKKMGRRDATDSGDPPAEMHAPEAKQVRGVVAITNHPSFASSNLKDNTFLTQQQQHN
jgi:hypothetical protein